MRWSNEDRERVRRNQKKRIPLRVTAAAVGRSIVAVRVFASANGYLQNKWTREQITQALEMKAFGHTSQEIGKVLGKTATCVRSKLWRMRHAKV